MKEVQGDTAAAVKLEVQFQGSAAHDTIRPVHQVLARFCTHSSTLVALTAAENPSKNYLDQITSAACSEPYPQSRADSGPLNLS
jgi:hypothetical protein